jgi:hypothetical protein
MSLFIGCLNTGESLFLLPAGCSLQMPKKRISQILANLGYSWKRELRNWDTNCVCDVRITRWVI